jgi:hypothetical protein
MADVFVSYAREDRARVQRVAEALERAGWSVWWDRQILAGNEFETVIQSELDHAACVLVAWSAASVASPWVRNEASEGLKRRVLIPLLLDDCLPPLAFRHLQAVRLETLPSVDLDSAEFQDLLSAIAALVGRTAGSRPLPGTHTNVTTVPPDWRPTPGVAPPPVQSTRSQPAGSSRGVLLGSAAVILVAGIAAYLGWPSMNQSGESPVPEPGGAVTSSAPPSPAPGPSPALPPSTSVPAPPRPDAPYDKPLDKPPQPSPEPPPPSVGDTIANGEPFDVVFDALLEPIGSIRPNGRYRVQYVPASRAWRASGPVFPEGSRDDVVGPADQGCDPSNREFCIWGVPFSFNDQGNVYWEGRRRVGRVEQ